jgi:hypothetical protein
MAKERKQDLASPEEESLEQRVREMLDVNVPDKEPKTSPSTTGTPTEEPAVPRPVSIAVTHDEEVKPQQEAAITEAIESTNEQLANEVGTAPLLEEPKPKKTAKKVEVVHDTVESESPVPIETEQEPVAEVEEEPTIETAIEEPPVSKQPTEIDTSATLGELMETTSPLEAELESAETDKAVSDIIAKEGDDLLAIQDTVAPPPVAKPSKSDKKDRPSLLGLIVRSPSFRWTLFILILVGLVVAGAYPKTRYYALNKAGIRSSASVIITDQSTLRPLKNVKVTLAGQTVMSDEKGKANLSNLLLGPTELVIEKRAYAIQKHAVTVGWGSNPLTDIGMKPQGVQYAFQVNDVFSGKPVTNVEASVGELSATANEKGEIKLALDQIETDEVNVVFNAPGYRKLTHKLKLANKETTIITLTPSKQLAFISKRSGVFDLYKVDADGQNEALVLKGTGKESSDISLFQHPTGDFVMLLSTRDGTYGAENALKQTLTSVNLKDKSTKTVTSSSQIKAIDWIGTRLVYVMLDDDAAGDNPARYKLMSYDYISGDNRQLATTNYFNNVVSMGGRIYYAPASAYQKGINVGVFAAHADGSGKEAILDKEAWNMFRTGRDTLTIAVQQEWYSYKQGAKKPEKLSGQPNETMSRIYIDSPDVKHSIWIDNRDGKGTIVLYDTTKNTEEVLLSDSGVSGPIRWLNNTAFVYRVSSSRETADYVLSIDGGSPKKVIDVTNAQGIERWTF